MEHSIQSPELATSQFPISGLDQLAPEDTSYSRNTKKKKSYTFIKV